MYEGRRRPKAMDDPDLYWLRDENMVSDGRPSKKGKK